MSSGEGTLDKATMVHRNLALAGEAIKSLLGDAAARDQLPNGSTVVLLPGDDPALSEANQALGLAALRAGEDVTFHHVRSSQPDQAQPERQTAQYRQHEVRVAIAFHRERGAPEAAETTRSAERIREKLAALVA
jgi:hypothetical protein